MLQLPFGTWLLGIAGAGVILYGATTVWRGISKQDAKHLRLPQDRKPLLEAICTYGLAARG